MNRRLSSYDGWTITDDPLRLQYGRKDVLYKDVLEQVQPERLLYLAIREAVFLDLFEEPI